MAFRSLYVLVAALALSSTGYANSGGNTLVKPSLRTAVSTSSTANHPLELSLGASSDQKSLNGKTNYEPPLRIMPPVGHRKYTPTFLPEGYPHWRFNDSGVRTRARLELPGKMRYRLLGEDRTRIVYGNWEYDLPNKKILFEDKKWSIPSLSLDSIVIGSITWPNFIKQLDTFPEAREKLRNSLDVLVNGIEKIIQPRQIQVLLDWGSFFGELLPRYTNKEGVIEPGNWDNIVNDVRRKAEDFYSRELTDSEKLLLDITIGNFKSEFTRLKDKFPLIKNVWEITGADDPFCQIKFGNIPLCDAYRMLRYLNPELVEINIGDGHFSMRTKPLNSTFLSDSASSQHFYDDLGRELTTTKFSRVSMWATGLTSFDGQLSEGIDIGQLLPGQYKKDLALLRILLGRDLTIIDAEANLQATYNFVFRSERMQGMQSSFTLDWLPGHHRLGMVVNYGTIYDNNSSGVGIFNGMANSHYNLLSAEFQGHISMEQYLRWREDVALFVSGDFDQLWYNFNLNLRHERINRLAETLGASWKYTANYSGQVRQNAWSLLNTRQIDTWHTFDINRTTRVGLNFGSLDLVAFTDFSKEVGTGIFVNLPQISLMAECAIGEYCNTEARIPLVGRLNITEERNHYLHRQQLAYSSIVGVDAVRQNENHRHNRQLPTGIFLDASIQGYFNEDRFPYMQPMTTEFGLTLPAMNWPYLDDTYVTARYIGNFDNINGTKLEFGSNWSYITVLYSHEWNRSRNTNTTTAEFSHTFHFKGFDITQFLELYPQAHDTRQYDGMPESDRKDKRDADFRYLFLARGETEALGDLLISYLPPVNLHSLEMNLSSFWGRLPTIKDTFKARYSLGKLNVYNEIGGHLVSNGSIGYDFLAESSYVIFAGLGPAIVTGSQRQSGRQDKWWLLPGIGFEQRFGHHYLTASATAWHKDGLFTNFRTRYEYVTDYSISPYFRMEAFSDLKFSEGKRIENRNASFSIYPGIKVGIATLAAEARILTRKDNLNLELGVTLGLDYYQLWKNKK